MAHRASSTAPPSAPMRRRPSALKTLLFSLAALLAAGVFIALIAFAVAVIGWLVLGGLNVLPDPDRKWPRLSAWAIVAIPVVAVMLAFLISRRASGPTFYDQQRTNRRVSLLLLVAMVGLLTALGEAIAASVTFDSLAALVGAGFATAAGAAAAGFAHFRGGKAVLDSARARPADPVRDQVLNDVVSELSVAANIPRPDVFVIEDGSMNAFAVGTRRDNGSLAVTRGLLDKMDREQLQGVVAHELGHIRNLDTRYGVYVAILVGLIALVTDGFLRIVLRAWAEGTFFRGADSDDARGAIAGLAAGIGIGVFLLVVAAFLRIFAPLASVLVQAATSRQREFLADATSVELTRNPVALSRALDALRLEHDPLDFANRGSQHLWFTSPFGATPPRWALLATHPALDERIARLAELYPSGVVAGAESIHAG